MQREKCLSKTFSPYRFPTIYFFMHEASKPYSVTYIHPASIFEWCVGRCGDLKTGTKKAHVQKLLTRMV